MMASSSTLPRSNHPIAASSTPTASLPLRLDNQLSHLLVLLLLLPLLSLVLLFSASSVPGSVPHGAAVSVKLEPALIPHATELKTVKNSGMVRQQQRRMLPSRRQLQFIPFPGFPAIAPSPPPVRQPPPGTTVSSTNITAQLSFNASATTTTNSPVVATAAPISSNSTAAVAATGAAPPATPGPHGEFFPNPVTTAGGALLGAVGGATTGAFAGAAAGAAAASGEGNRTGAGGVGQGAGIAGSAPTAAVPSPAVMLPPPAPLMPLPTQLLPPPLPQQQLPPPLPQQQFPPPLPPAQQEAPTVGDFSVAPAGNFAAGALLGSALGAAAGTAAAAAGSAVASAAQGAASAPPQMPPPQQQVAVQSPAPPAPVVTPGGLLNETLHAVGELSGQGSVVVNGDQVQMQMRAGRGLRAMRRRRGNGETLNQVSKEY
ncbi:hypothetical protein CLOM_g20700 [Closterium sp. NIES-68]|nr:hypothetical protein CLOM_g20700 [Closterium sp. NIES-68]GJP82407.1 hypothetical protein CLOP_g12669 [Closterium sp. NIES-67]